MSKRNLSQSSKSQIRNEIRNEIETAIKMNVEQGTVVTSQGDCFGFRIERTGRMTFVMSFGHAASSAKDAAQFAMHELGYTRS